MDLVSGKAFSKGDSSDPERNRGNVDLKEEFIISNNRKVKIKQVSDFL